VRQVGAGAALEQFARNVRRAARAGRAASDLATSRPRSQWRRWRRSI